MQFLQQLLEAVIPSSRTVRPTLTAGLLWIFSIWMVIAGMQPAPAGSRAERVASSLDSALDLLGTAGRGVLAFVLIWLLGSLTEPAGHAIQTVAREIHYGFRRVRGKNRNRRRQVSIYWQRVTDAGSALEQLRVVTDRESASVETLDEAVRLAKRVSYRTNNADRVIAEAWKVGTAELDAAIERMTHQPDSEGGPQPLHTLLNEVEATVAALKRSRVRKWLSSWSKLIQISAVYPDPRTIPSDEIARIAYELGFSDATGGRAPRDDEENALVRSKEISGYAAEISGELRPDTWPIIGRTPRRDEVGTLHVQTGPDPRILAEQAFTEAALRTTVTLPAIALGLAIVFTWDDTASFVAPGQVAGLTIAALAVAQLFRQLAVPRYDQDVLSDALLSGEWATRHSRGAYLAGFGAGRTEPPGLLPHPTATLDGAISEH